MIQADLLPDPGLLFSLLIESLLESLALYLVVLAAFRIFAIGDAALRARFMLLPLVVPVLLGTAFHLFVEATGPLSSLKMAEGFLHELVAPLAWAGPGITLAFGVAAFLGGWQLLQGLAARLFLEWRWARDERGDEAIRRRCQRLLEKVLAEDGGQPNLRVICSRLPGIHALGYRRPFLVLQPALVQALGDEEMEAALAHELAHLRLSHGPLASLARFCRNLMWFNPAAHLAYRRFCEHQEEAADDGAVALTGNPLALAASLVKGLRFRQGWAPAAGSALWGRGLPLERRILRLVHYQLPERTRRHRWLLWGLALVSTLGFALLW